MMNETKIQSNLLFCLIFAVTAFYSFKVDDGKQKGKANNKDVVKTDTTASAANKNSLTNDSTVSKTSEKTKDTAILKIMASLKAIENKVNPPFHRKDTMKGSTAGDFSSINSAMFKLLDSLKVPGGQLSIAYDKCLVYDMGFDYADSANGIIVDRKSKFRIASVSKAITAVAIMYLVQNGKLKLDDTVFGGLHPILKNYYQENDSTDKRIKNITIRELLAHRGGWNRDIMPKYDPPFDAIRIGV